MNEKLREAIGKTAYNEVKAVDGHLLILTWEELPEVVKERWRKVAEQVVQALNAWIEEDSQLDLESS